MMKCTLNRTMVLLLVSAFNTACAQECANSSRYFRVDSVTKLTAHAGVDGAGSSVTYEVFFKVRKKFQMFDSAWAYGDRSIVILKTAKGASPVFKRNRTFSLMINVNYNSDPRPDSGWPKRINPPLKCKEELILRYKAGKKNRTIALSKFKILPTINLP